MKTDRPQCSRCINANLQVSRKRGFLDGFMARLGLQPMRCRSCQRRVYVRAALVERKSSLSQVKE